MPRKRKRLFLLLLLYLVFDVRPLLLIPNLILFLKPCARYTNRSGAIELRVFPKLGVAGDPIRAGIRSHGLPLGGAFARDYDRSGIFHELEFSGTINKTHPVETLYWTIGFGGGLGGVINPKKDIWLGDYVHFDRIGRYRLNLRYRDQGWDLNSETNAPAIDDDLGNFSVFQFPENPVSKLLKQVLCVAGLYVPSDEVRVGAVKCLGYQETAISTYALAKYRSLYEAEWHSTVHPYNNSLAETHRGVLRNYDFCQVGKILRRFERGQRNSILATYLDFHCRRLIWSDDNPGNLGPTGNPERDIKRLIQCTYGYLAQTNKTNFAKNLASLREFEADEHWLASIEKTDRELAQTTNQKKRETLEDRKKRAEAMLGQRERRHRRLQLVDCAMACLEEEPPLNVRRRQSARLAVVRNLGGISWP